MKSAMVTGASGFIGKMLIEELLKRDYRVIALDIKFDDFFLNNEFIVCINVMGKEIEDLLNEIPKFNFDFFFHLAWAGTSGIDRSNYEVQLNNVKNTCKYIELCRDLGCKRVIYASSINEMETYEYLQSDDINPVGGYIYGTGKLAAHLMGETVAKINGVEFIPVIITNIYGVGEKSARMIYTSISKLLKKEHCSFTEGNQIYDFVYITDAINSIVAVAEKGKPFNRYYIGSGNPKPLKEFLNEMKNTVDKSAILGLGDIPFNGADISYNQFQLDKVYKDTGYCNQVDFSTGIEMTTEYIRKELGL
ncbi:MAG: NAD(P)-dependent oxidoreductase [Erysipelotrichaceae bacterium]